MRGPYGFEMTDSCLACKTRKVGFFCQMSPKAVKDFDSLKTSSAYPEGAVLFLENQEPRGVFVVCEGEIKLTVSSSEGRTLILNIAKPGEILGLMSVVSGKPYEVTAETIHPSQIAYIRREDFLRFMTQYPEIYEAATKQLSSDYLKLCEQLRTVGLASSAPEKLARLLLEWSADAEETQLGTRIHLKLTHEEIAEFIGSSRETVTRTLSDFKNKHLVKLNGAILTIPSRAALESLVVA
jgi:CRP/FNR family cyclic AMP-dependent transcriptional regulator